MRIRIDEVMNAMNTLYTKYHSSLPIDSTIDDDKYLSVTCVLSGQYVDEVGIVIQRSYTEMMMIIIMSMLNMMINMHNDYYYDSQEATRALTHSWT